jgi:AcrR family transcriptional regulator
VAIRLSTERAPKTQRRRLSASARRELIATAAAATFAERGYAGASVDEIAARAGVSPPVVYDHFDSKRELFRFLLERHFAELREVWGAHFPGEGEAGERVAAAIDAWFAYVEEHPFAGRLLFRETSGDAEVAAMHAEVAAASKAALIPLVGSEPAIAALLGGDGGESGAMVWEIFRGALQALATWWYDHPEVPRQRVVALAMNALWIGFERAGRGEVWPVDG